jgi:4'-phosphopantetheinyl transferase
MIAASEKVLEFRGPGIPALVKTGLGPGAPAVWMGWLDRPRREAARLSSHLSSAERARAQRFRSEVECRRFIVGRGWLRLLLARRTGQAPSSLSIEYGSSGKPRLACQPHGKRLHFNVAHSGKLFLCTISEEAEVGVDVEHVRIIPEIDAVADAVFAPEEARALSGLPVQQRVEAFYRCWTGMEALAKAIGTGLGEPLPRLPIAPDGTPPEGVLVHAGSSPAQRWRLFEFSPTAGYVAALVVAAR